MEPIVEFIMDGKLFASRSWIIIPRIGEIVLLRNGEIFAEVQNVFWGDDSASPSSMKRQWVQIICKQVDRGKYV